MFGGVTCTVITSWGKQIEPHKILKSILVKVKYSCNQVYVVVVRSIESLLNHNSVHTALNEIFQIPYLFSVEKQFVPEITLIIMQSRECISNNQTNNIRSYFGFLVVGLYNAVDSRSSCSGVV